MFLSSCNQCFYKHYQPYINLGQDINYLKQRITIDNKIGYINDNRAIDYNLILNNILIDLYDISYKAKKPILMPFNGRNLKSNTK